MGPAISSVPPFQRHLTVSEWIYSMWHLRHADHDSLGNVPRRGQNFAHARRPPIFFSQEIRPHRVQSQTNLIFSKKYYISLCTCRSEIIWIQMLHFKVKNSENKFLFLSSIALYLGGPFLRARKCAIYFLLIVQINRITNSLPCHRIKEHKTSEDGFS